jgi:hypothetical protein
MWVNIHKFSKMLTAIDNLLSYRIKDNNGSFEVELIKRSKRDVYIIADDSKTDSTSSCTGEEISLVREWLGLGDE